MTFKELRIASGMSRPDFAKYFEIPYRTVQSWERYGEAEDGRQCPDYLMKLMQYKLEREAKATHGDKTKAQQLYLNGKITKADADKIFFGQ